MAKHRYTILSMMKNEGHCLLEWVAYHHLMGFDNICVYTNNCTDGTDRMLMRLEELGYCRHFRNDVPEGKKPQPNALSLAEKNPEVTDSDWLLVMDADEFLNIKTGNGTVQALMDALPDGTDAVNITWRFFGSNGVTDWNPGLVTESLTRAAPDDFKKGWGVKTLFRPFEGMKLGIHRPHMKKARQFPERARALKAQSWVNGSGMAMADDFKLSGWRSTKPTLGYDLVEMNHYAVKSYEAYLLRRMRGNVNNKEDKYNANYFAIFDRNETEQRGAADRGPRVRALMDEMLADEALRGLQEEALAFHRAAVDRLRGTGEYDDWLASLKEAGALPIDRLDEVLFTLHLPAKYQEVVRHMRERGVPDKVIAKMINAQQTGRKAATRRDLHAVAGGEEDISEETATPPEEDDGLSAEALADRIIEQMRGSRKVRRFLARGDGGAWLAEVETDGGDGRATQDDAPAPPRRMRLSETARQKLLAMIQQGRVRVAGPAAGTLGPEGDDGNTAAAGDADEDRGGTGAVEDEDAADGAGKVDSAPSAPRPRHRPPFSGDGRRIVVATMKNEGPYLLEWIAHHLNIGFDGFVLFSNDCTDGTNLMLNRLDAMGVVRHFDNPLGPRMDPQRRAYSRANRLDEVRGASWVLVADADEFLNVHAGEGTLNDLLDACPRDTEAVSVNWRLFGSGGARRMEPAPVTRRFTRACHVDTPENGLVWGFKTLFRPQSFDYFGVHRPRFSKSAALAPDQVKWVNAGGQDMEEQYLRTGWRSNDRIVSYEFAQMNHYAVKSREEFLLKRLRGTANSKDKGRIDLGYWEKFDLNACEDSTIRSGDLEGTIATLLEDEELAALHRATLDHARRTIAKQMQDEELAAFVEAEDTRDEAKPAAE